jgi:glycosyltransferase involved in cell wall biosynthesis
MTPADKPDPAPGISIVVCTRNRAAQLGASLEAIRQSIAYAPHLAAELIIVDNGSTDETNTILKAQPALFDVPVRTVFEKRPGLAAARNTGVFLARYPVIAMTDDDCRPDKTWIAQLASAYAADGAPVIRGGRVELGDPADLPLSIRQGKEPEQLAPDQKPDGFVIGANFSFHRQVFVNLGGFDERFGAGARYKAAEETDFVLRAAAQGIPVLYDPGLLVHHFHGRRSARDMSQLVSGYCFSGGALYAKHFFSNRIARRSYSGWVKTIIKENLGLIQSDSIAGYPSFTAMFINVNRGFITYMRHR